MSLEWPNQRPKWISEEIYKNDQEQEHRMYSLGKTWHCKGAVSEGIEQQSTTMRMYKNYLGMI